MSNINKTTDEYDSDDTIIISKLRGDILDYIVYNDDNYNKKYVKLINYNSPYNRIYESDKYLIENEFLIEIISIDKNIIKYKSDDDIITDGKIIDVIEAIISESTIIYSNYYKIY